VGWGSATTEFVAFLDADDEWHPKKLEILLNWFSKNPQAIFCSHQCIRYTGYPVEINSKQFMVRSFKFRDILISNPFSTPAVMLRTGICHRFPVSLRYAEDYYLWLIIAAEVRYLNRIELPLSWYFKAPYGESGLSGNLWAMEKGELAALRELRKQGHVRLSVWVAISLFSIAKFAMRCWRVM
jgi:glycosyltransferase involved in cell wall biosynthesis